MMEKAPKIPNLDDLLNYDEEYSYPKLIYDDYFTPTHPEENQPYQNKNKGEGYNNERIGTTA